MGQIYLALILSIFVNRFNNTASWYVAVLGLLPFLVPVDRLGRIWTAIGRTNRATGRSAP
jgi:hypothetical protein